MKKTCLYLCVGALISRSSGGDGGFVHVRRGGMAVPCEVLIHY